MNTQNHIAPENGFMMNYIVFSPDNYENLPLIIYLHGAGERGEDISHLYRHGVPKIIADGIEIPAVVLAPQCPRELVWDNVVVELKKVIDAVIKEYGIKKDRIMITGSSMGGFGTWMMAKTYPSFFAAIAPVSGGGMSWRAANLKSTPILAYHGTDDEVVPPVYSRLMVDAVNALGGNAKFFELSGYGHNDAIDYAYEKTELLSWLVSRRRTDFKRVSETFEEYF